MMSEDTIAAISTANGRGGVAIIRISGPEALSVAQKMFDPAGKTAVKDFKPYRMYPGTIDAGAFTDFGLCVYFRAPGSYTGEDIVEFHCHGGTEIAKGVLKRAFSLGGRPAEAGEFTKRAFLNGKMSLSAAEGVADMINAQSQSLIKAGYSLYKDKLNEKIEAVRKELTTLLASIEVDIDYPEEELQATMPDLKDLKSRLGALSERLKILSRSYERVGKQVKNGVTVAIVGLPNSGKSSLLNAMLGYDKAIVSDIAGTTRDVVEGEIDMKGFLFHLYDTAGIRESEDCIERIGVEKAERLLDEADMVLHVIDPTAPQTAENEALHETVKRKGRMLSLTLLNKIDLFDEKRIDPPFGDTECILVSAKEKYNVEEVMHRMCAALENAYDFNSQFVVEERHYRALSAAIERLDAARENCDTIPLDVLTVDITQAWSALGEITGETANEEIINEIFSKFCVGK